MTEVTDTLVCVQAGSAAQHRSGAEALHGDVWEHQADVQEHGFSVCD